MALFGKKKAIIYSYFKPDAFKLAGQLNSISRLTADMSHIPEQTVLNCQKSGK